MTPDQWKDILLLIGGGVIELVTSLVMYCLEGKRERRRLQLEQKRGTEQKRWDLPKCYQALSGAKMAYEEVMNQIEDSTG
ncbi:MAG: hypothetical protein V3T92_03760 [Anaerolineae bacterium]